MNGAPPRPSAPADRIDAALVVLVAVAVTAAVGRAGFAAYVDNAPHLLEVRVLADQILPVERWYAGWTDLAEAGTSVGLLNAPLLWSALAGLVALGLPLIPLYALATVASNVAVGLAALRLGRRLSGAPGAGLAAGALAAGLVTEVWGVGGATGGMWPFRFGLALILWGIGTGPGPAWRRAVWVAATLLSHMFAGLILCAWVAVEAAGLALEGRGREAARGLAGATLGLLLAAIYLFPVLTSRVTEFPGIALAAWPVGGLLAAMFTPADPYWLPADQPVRWIGGLAAWAAFGPAWLGVLAAASSARGAAVGARVRALLALVGLLTAGAAVVIMTGATVLGPVPWRYFAVTHLAIAVAGGVGLATVGGRRAALALAPVVALGGAWVGNVEVPARTPEAAAAWAALDAAWDDVAALPTPGRVYVDDPMQDRDAPPSMEWTHVGPLLTLRHGLPTLGSWYGIVPGLTHQHTLSESGFVVGMTVKQAREHPEVVSARLRTFGVGSVVAFSRPLVAALEGAPGWQRVSERPPFVVYAATQPLLPLLGSPDATTTLTPVSDGSSARNRYVVVVAAEGPTHVRLRQTWHPWWRASLDGQPIPVGEADDLGFVNVAVEHPGALVVEWTAIGRGPAVALSLLGLVAVLGLAAGFRRESRGAPSGG